MAMKQIVCNAKNLSDFGTISSFYPLYSGWTPQCKSISHGIQRVFFFYLAWLMNRGFSLISRSWRTCGIVRWHLWTVVFWAPVWCCLFKLHYSSPRWRTRVRWKSKRLDNGHTTYSPVPIIRGGDNCSFWDFSRPPDSNYDPRTVSKNLIFFRKVRLKLVIFGKIFACGGQNWCISQQQIP